MLKTIEALNWRYATKIFDEKESLSDDQLNHIAEIVRLNPSSMGIQPYRFLLLSDKEIQKQLTGASYGQKQISSASALGIWVIGDPIAQGWIDRAAELNADIRGIDPVQAKSYMDNFKQKMASKTQSERLQWAARQAYIALGSLMTALALEGIDSCPMEGFDPQRYDQILGLDEQGLSTVVVLAIGKRSEQDQTARAAKVRRPQEEFLIPKQEYELVSRN